MRIGSIAAIILLSALLLPMTALASGDHEGGHPPGEVVQEAIEMLEGGQFVEAEDELRGIVNTEEPEGVNLELVREALTALEEAEEDRAIDLLKRSIEGLEIEAH